MRRGQLRFAGWELVAIAAIAMGTAGVYQFGWSSIRVPMGTRLGLPEPALGTVFTLFIVFQTIGQFPAGWVRDRYGPRIPLVVAAGCLTLGFAGVALADTPRAVYLAYSIGGIGVSFTYTVAINTPVKWFDERRGLATGVVTMAYSGVSFLFIPFIRTGTAHDFRTTLLILGAITGVASLLAAVVLRDPPTPRSRSSDAPATPGGYSFGWRETIRTWQFWLLYVVFMVVNGVGLMVIGKVISFAGALSLPAAAGTASASLIAIADAAGVLIGGSLSDRFGRRRTVAVSLVLCGIALIGAVVAGVVGWGIGFVVLIGASAFFRSPPFAVFPTIVGEYYGRTFSSENYAALYSAKLFGGALGGTVASTVIVWIGWSSSFALGAGMIALAGIAMVFLRPVTARSASPGQ